MVTMCSCVYLVRLALVKSLDIRPLYMYVSRHLSPTYTIPTTDAISMWSPQMISQGLGDDPLD